MKGMLTLFQKSVLTKFNRKFLHLQIQQFHYMHHTLQ